MCFELFSDIVEIYWLLCFLFWQSSSIFYFRFWWKICNSNINFCNAHLQSSRISLKIDFIGCLISIRSELNYSQIVIFIFWWTLKQLVPNSPLYLIFIATYNKHLFTIILKIHIFAIFRRSTDVFYTFALFWYQNSVVFLFFLLIQYSIEISLHIFTFYLFSFFVSIIS